MSNKFLGIKINSSKLIIIGGLLIVAAILFLLKPGSIPDQSDLSLESQLDAALQENRPTFVFLH